MSNERRPQLVTDYDVYHDESQIAGYWHGILFVPRPTRQQLLNILADIRRRTNYQNPVSLKNLDHPHGPKFKCTRAWLHTGIAALIQNLKGERYPILTAEDARSIGYGLLESILGARFAIFRIRDGHRALANYPDHAAKIETTFRMGLKGSLAIFASEGNEICIRSLHFDGHEHYHRRVDPERIFGRIGELPPQANLHDAIELDDRTSDHRKEASQSPDDCQLLQLTDVLVSGFRTALSEATSPTQRDLCAPLKQLADRWKKGPARMKNSRWFKGFCISEAFLENDQWKFAPIEQTLHDKQQILFKAHQA